MSYRRKRRRGSARAEIAPSTQVIARAKGHDALAAAATQAGTEAETTELALYLREPETESDLAAIHLLCMLHGHEMAAAEVNPGKVMRKLVYAAQNPDSHTMLMAIKDGRLVGHLLIEKVGWWYSDRAFLADFGFFVLPACRGGDVGPTLLREADAIAKAADMPLMIVRNDPRRRRGSILWLGAAVGPAATVN
jgi:predicted N-acetyltransferase YhbS